MVSKLAFLRRLRACRRGATAVEYGLIAALIVIACVAGITQLGGSLSGQWNNINSKL